MNGKHFIGNQQLSRKLIGRTKEALRQRNVQFAQAHGDASDEALLDYVRSEAARFGGWQNVITSAGLPSPKKQKPTSKRQIFKEELRCQARERAYTEQQNSSEQSGGRRGSPSSVIGKPL